MRCSLVLCSLWLAGGSSAFAESGAAVSFKNITITVTDLRPGDGQPARYGFDPSRSDETVSSAFLGELFQRKADQAPGGWLENTAAEVAPGSGGVAGKASTSPGAAQAMVKVRDAARWRDEPGSLASSRGHLLVSPHTAITVAVSAEVSAFDDDVANPSAMHAAANLGLYWRGGHVLDDIHIDTSQTAKVDKSRAMTVTYVNDSPAPVQIDVNVYLWAQATDPSRAQDGSAMGAAASPPRVSLTRSTQAQPRSR
jgi:hypothetical protein